MGVRTFLVIDYYNALLSGWKSEWEPYVMPKLPSTFSIILKLEYANLAALVQMHNKIHRNFNCLSLVIQI